MKAERLIRPIAATAITTRIIETHSRRWRVSVWAREQPGRQEETQLPAKSYGGVYHQHGPGPCDMLTGNWISQVNQASMQCRTPCAVCSGRRE